MGEKIAIIDKAKETAEKVKSSTASKLIKPRYSVVFRRPKTQIQCRNVRNVKNLINKRCKLDHFSIINHPLTSETALEKIRDHSTLVFIVNKMANKKQIKHALMKIYKIQPIKVNTLICSNGKKKAFVKLSKKTPHALDDAN